MLSAHAHNLLGLAYYLGKGRQQAQDIYTADVLRNADAAHGVCALQIEL